MNNIGRYIINCNHLFKYYIMKLSLVFQVLKFKLLFGYNVLYRVKYLNKFKIHKMY